MFSDANLYFFLFEFDFWNLGFVHLVLGCDSFYCFEEMCCFVPDVSVFGELRFGFMFIFGLFSLNF